MSKKLLLIGGGVAALLVGGAFVAPSFIDWSSYKAPALDAARKATGYDITVDGRLSVSLLPTPSLNVRNVTIRLPEQSPDAYLAKFDRLSVSVALLPLLSGRVAVNEVVLDKPDIHVTLDANNQPDWMTPTLKGEGTDAAPAEPAATSPSAKKQFNLAVNDIRISDGSVVVKQPSTKKIYELENINTRLRLDSLQGPYAVRGGLEFNHVPFRVSADVGAMADVSSDVALKAEISAPDHATTLKYDGVLSRHGGMGVQGQLTLDGKRWVSVASALSGAPVSVPEQPLVLSTLLSADQRNIVLDNILFSYGDLALEGVVKTRLVDSETKRPIVHARLSAKDTLQAQKIMASFGQTSSTKEKAGEKAATQPKKSAATSNAFNLPADLDIEITAPGIQMAAAPLKDINLTITAKGSDIRGRLQAAEIPGTGHLDVTAYPGEAGAVTLDTKLKVAEPAQLVERGLGYTLPSATPVDKLRNFDITGSFFVAPGRFEAHSGAMEWSTGDVDFTGTSYRSNTGGRPVLTLALKSKNLDVDSLLGTGPSSSGSSASGSSSAPVAKGALKDTLLKSVSGINLPLDINASVAVAQLKATGKTFKDLQLDGKLTPNTATISSLKVGDLEGVTMAASGSIGALKTLGDINLKLSGSANDTAAAMRAFGMTPPQTGKDLGAARVALGYVGSLDQANVDADVTMWGVTFGAAGPVTDPLGVPQVSNLKVDISAPNAASAIRAFQPGFNATAPLQGPLKVTADTTIKGKTYALTNLNGTAGTMTVKGDIGVDLSGARPSVSGGLTLGDVPLDALMGVNRTASGGNAVSTTSATKTGDGAKWSSEALNTDWMRAMDMDFSIAAKSMTYNMWVLNTPSLSLDMKGGVLNVHDVQAGLFGGKLSASGKMAATAANSPITIAAKTDMSGVNARSLTNALMNKSMNKVDGTIGFNFDVDSSGASPAALVSGLNGAASSGGQNVTINGIDVAKLTTWLSTDLKPSTTVDGITGSFFGNGSTTFEKHEGAYTIKAGNITIDNMIFDGAQASLKTTGGTSLPSWTIDTTSTLQVKNPANVPALTFALKGSLSNPGSSLGKGLFQNYLQSQIEKQVGKVIEKQLGSKLQGMGLGGLLGGSTSQPVAPAATPATPEAVEPAAPAQQVAPAPAPQQEVKPEDVLLDVLKGLGN